MSLAEQSLTPSGPGQPASADEAAARVELAGFYRLVEHLGWGDGIYNHIALRAPGEPHRFLIKAHAITYEEVTASNLVKVDAREDLDERAGVNKVGFTTHAPILRARQDVNCTIHLHTIPIMAIAAHPMGLRMVHQNSVFFFEKVAYQDYEGLAERVEDQQRLVDDLGANRVLIMRNHGAVITGVSVEQTFAMTLRFVQACQIQLAIEAAGQGVVEIAPDVCRLVARQLDQHDRGRGGADWPAWLRRLDRIDPSYKN
jgi:ribulose-5-phosphate 4-epimerase/fuculose-1-phosphate aldolase